MSQQAIIPLKNVVPRGIIRQENVSQQAIIPLKNVIQSGIIRQENVIQRGIIRQENVIQRGIIRQGNVILSINLSVFPNSPLFTFIGNLKNMPYSFSATGISL